MTNPGRLRDLADVLELIRILALPRDFGQQLNAYVRSKYDELWQQSMSHVDEPDFWGQKDEERDAGGRGAPSAD